MKVFFRLLVTAAVVIAIVIGVRALIGDRRTESYVFDKLEWKTEYSSEGINQNLNDFYQYKTNNSDRFAADGDLKQIGESLDSGNYYKIDNLYQKAQTMFASLKNQSALAQIVTKDLQNDVIESYNKFVKSIQTEKETCQAFMRLINSASQAPDDVIAYFVRVQEAYENVLDSLIDLNDNLREYVLKEVYHQKLTTFEDIKLSLNVEMMKAYANDKNLEIDMTLMSTNLEALDETAQNELVINYANVESISLFLSSEEKSVYAQNANQSIKNIAKILFGIDA